MNNRDIIHPRRRFCCITSVKRFKVAKFENTDSNVSKTSFSRPPLQLVVSVSFHKNTELPCPTWRQAYSVTKIICFYKTCKQLILFFANYWKTWTSISILWLFNSNLLVSTNYYCDYLTHTKSLALGSTIITLGYLTKRKTRKLPRPPVFSDKYIIINELDFSRPPVTPPVRPPIDVT